MATPIQRFRFLFADDRSLYGVAAGGELIWYPAWSDPATPPNLAEGRQIGVGWAGFDHVFAGGDGILYAVRNDGALLWYRDLFRNGTNAPDGSFGWDANSGSQVGQGWTGFANLFSGDNGIIYAIRPDGPLLWYQDLNRDGSNAPDGSSGWAANSGSQIGSGWSGFRHVVPGGGGTIYLVNPKGELLWYRDEFRDGSNHPSGATGWAAASGSRIASGWDFFTHLIGGDTGLIYACRTTEFGGAMRRYLDLFLDGSNGPGGAGWDVAVAESSTGWQFPAIEGYCWPMSVSPAETLSFHVSASSPGRARVSYLRLGGRGPRLGVLVENGPDFDATFQSSGTFAADCGWPIAFELTPDAGHWPPGFYAARVQGIAGAPYDIPFVVKRGAERAPLAMLVNVNTWNAYNSWGGASNYTGMASPIDLTHKRPNHHLLSGSTDHVNGNHMLRSEIWMHSWLKAQGYEVDLYTDIDLENGVEGLANYKALILNTHPEYWTRTMMQQVSGYLDAGGRLLYLGGNAHYRPTSLRAQVPGGDVDLMTSEIILWDSFPQYEGKPLLAAESANLGGPGRGNGYTISNPAHPFMPGGLMAGQPVGLTGWNGTPGAPWGASGWETDHWAAPPADVAVLARDTAPAGGVIACFDTSAGGFVLGVGSLTFVGSLMEDAILQQIVNNALAAALSA